MEEISDLSFDFGHPKDNSCGEFPDGWFEYDSFVVNKAENNSTLRQLSPFTRSDLYYSNIVQVSFIQNGRVVKMEYKSRYWFIANKLKLNEVLPISLLLNSYYNL